MLPNPSVTVSAQALTPLVAHYDLVAADLDGVVYIGPHPVPGAVETFELLRRDQVPCAFITNNAARPPQMVAAHLTELGITATSTDVVTSAQAAADLLAERLPAGGLVFVIGGEGLHVALQERELRTTTTIDDDVLAVMQGAGAGMPWRQIADGAILVKRGLPWIVTNGDLTAPTPHGVGPGTGAAAQMVGRFAHREPVIAGKPNQALFVATQTRTNAKTPVVVGDRVDTDILGARTMGWDSLLVMSGVTDLSELVQLSRSERPTYVGHDIGALYSCGTPGRWQARFSQGKWEISGHGNTHQWWQAVATAAWRHLDIHNQPATATNLTPGFATVEV